MQLSFRMEVYQPDRYRISNPYPRDYNLEILSVRTDDAGIYKCLIGTRPPVTKRVQLVVEGSLVYKKTLCDKMMHGCQSVHFGGMFPHFKVAF